MSIIERQNVPIEIKTFGSFNILYKGENIFFGQNNAAKPIEILKFMTANKGKELTIESIVENIWPDNEYTDEKTVIRTYIHRLRKMISSDNRLKTDLSSDLRIDIQNGRYRFDISENVDFDIDNLISLKNEIKENLDAKTLETYFKKLLHIYTGEYIADTPFTNWVTMYRNYYTRIFCSAANTILNALYKMNEYEKLVELCDESLKIYDLDENTNIVFLNALIELNRTGTALQHYTYITSKMYTELNVMPSEKLLEVYSRIKPDKRNSRLSVQNLRDVTEEDMSDTKKIMSVINDLNDVAKKLMSGIDKYSAGYIMLQREKTSSTVQIDETTLYDILERSIRMTLRKNDMYVVFDPYTAVIVLTDAQEEYFKVINKRICEEFFKHYNNLNIKFSMEISRVTTIR